MHFPVVTEIEGAGGGTLDPHFVFDISRTHVIEFPQAAVIVYPVLGNEKDGDASCPRGDLLRFWREQGE